MELCLLERAHDHDRDTASRADDDAVGISATRGPGTTPDPQTWPADESEVPE